ncbi:MAG: hypothetical protein ABL934_06220 [Lysobacteraceae bacterium]
MKQRSKWWALLVGGSIAGALDLLFAVSFAAYNGTAPMELLQTVASGALGEAAFTGGAPAAALGLLLHFMLSYAWAGVFLLAAMRVPALVRRPLVSGLVFGIVVFLMMRLVVLPLSAFPFAVKFRPLASILDLLSHIFFFGVPIALAARRALQR